MNKNVLVILLIFLVPVTVYWALSRDKAVTVIPTVAFSGPEIIKFSSPMCYECQELEKVFDEVYPEYASKVILRHVDVTQRDKATRNMIKNYKVKLVPTCIFKDKKGDTIRKTEGMIQPKILENYIKEQINE